MLQHVPERKDKLKLNTNGNGGAPWTCTTTAKGAIDLFSKQSQRAGLVDAPVKWYRVKDSHPQPPRSERGASSDWANAAIKFTIYDLRFTILRISHRSWNPVVNRKS